MTLTPGTRYALTEETQKRLEVTARLRHLFASWGYGAVDVPVLEPYDPAHPASKGAFKLGGLEGDLLALRADFTPAIARMVKLHYPELAVGPDAAEPEVDTPSGTPGRFQYCGRLWRTVVPDIARTREFTEIGLELIGVSNPKADAELVHLAREAVREVGLAPRVEVGNPGFVRCLFELAEIPDDERGALASAIDRKDMATLRTLLEPHPLAPDLRDALLNVPDLYGDVMVLQVATRIAPWTETKEEVERLEVILHEFEDDSELLLDLGMARRLSYYTGMTFRAYTFDFGQPLLGGGRYDGVLLPYAAGFAVGLERLLSAVPRSGASEGASKSAPLVLSLDDEASRHLRAHGYRVERALTTNIDDLKRYARARGVAYLLSDAGLDPLTAARPFYEELLGLLEVPA